LAATGLTSGRVTNFVSAFQVEGPNARTIISRRFEVEGFGGAAFARNGDSGAAVVTKDHFLIGILQAVQPSGTALILPWRRWKKAVVLCRFLREVTFSFQKGSNVFAKGFF